MKTAILIPAYKPSAALIPFVQTLAARDNVHVVVVDDGNGASHAEIFSELKSQPNVHILTHAINQGKGMALKTGFRFICENKATYGSVVTADADGQHRIEDILKVSAELLNHPSKLILGSRSFTGKVPLRSSFGNSLTRFMFRTVAGLKIQDTQTGLRALSVDMLAPFLDIPFNRYEYETEMLLLSSRRNIPIHEVPIETIYENNNASSHFNPFLDSLKIYFVLFRYTLASLLSAVVDFAVFMAVQPLIGNILLSTYASRAVSLGVNYGLVSKKVFYDRHAVRQTFPKYLLLVIVSGFLSSALIHILVDLTPLSVTVSKILAESLLYVVNFVIQKELIFNDRKRTH